MVAVVVAVVQVVVAGRRAAAVARVAVLHQEAARQTAVVAPMALVLPQGAAL